MAHVLCITSGLTGILNASVELVRRLEAAGHRVTCLSPSPVREAVEGQGLRFEALPAFVRDPVPKPPPRGGRLRRVVARYTSRRARIAAGAEVLQIDASARILSGLGADLAIIDIESHESILAAHQIGLPTLLLSQFFSLWPGTGQPPLSSPSVPGEVGPEAVEAEWAEAIGRRQAAHRRLRRQGLADRSDALLHHARQVGFPTREWARGAFPPPFVYRTLPVLAMTLEALEFPQRRRPGLHYVGPMVAPNRRDVRATADTEAEADAAIARARAADAWLVYAPASSMDAGDGALLQTLVNVVAHRTDWHLVAGRGGHTEAALGALPANVTVFDYAPQLRLLEAADAAVVHGGINTLHECLHAEVPMLAVSGGRHDQNGCVARLAHHGLGLRGDPDRLGAAELEHDLERVLTEASFRDALARFQRLADRHREANTVAEVVAAHLPG
ncbi:MAG: nucleotide disphospho-sugar-binding domain-containing protein [Bacteroidota bacterium]